MQLAENIKQAGSWIAAENFRKNELSRSLRRLLLAITDLHEVCGKEMGVVS